MILTKADFDRLGKTMAYWLKRWRRDPVAYVIECIGDTPTYQQAKALRKWRKHGKIAIRSGHGIGKSRLLAWVINCYLDCFKEKGKLCRIPITGPAYDQLKLTLWAEVCAVNESKPDFLKNNYEINTDLMYNKTDGKGWFAAIRTAREDKPDALQGFHSCLFVIDEGSGVPDSVFEVARGAMGDPESMAIMTGNPTRLRGYFYNAFNSRASIWHCLHFRSDETLYEKEYSYKYVNAFGDIVTITHRGRQTTAWVEEMKKEFGETSNAYKIRVKGDFASGKGDLVIPKEWMKNIFTRPFEKQVDRKRVLGADIARGGNDNSAIVIREGNHIIYIKEWHDPDLHRTRSIIKTAFDEFDCDKIVIDEIGVGAGVADELKAEGYPVIMITCSNTAPDSVTPCDIMRDYLWWEARQFIKKFPVLILDTACKHELAEDLIDELSCPTYGFTRRGAKIKVESKDDLKGRNIASPNLADAFCLSLVTDFNSKIKKRGKSGRDRRQEAHKRHWRRHSSSRNYKVI